MTWPLVGRKDEFTRLTAAPVPGTGTIVVGAPGVGKTRLARAALEADYARGARTEWVTGAASAGGVPFGALAHLIEDVDLDSADTTRMFRVATRLLSPPSYGSLVIGVDDVHLLDLASAAAIHHAIVTSNASIIATARRGHELPEPIAVLARDGRVETLHLRPLSDDDIAQLLAVSLGPDIDGTTSDKVCAAAEGNPMLLRELIDAGIESGALYERDGLWTWSGPFAAPRLQDLVEARLGRLSAEQRAAVEVLAVGEPLSLDTFETIVGAATTNALDRLDLVETRPDVRRTTVALAHPLYGDVLRDTMSALQSRALQRRLADAFASQDAIADADVVRLVGWRLDLGEPVAIDYLTRAARRALGASDFVLAERFARVAAERRASSADRTLLGIALAGQGRIDEAHGVLAATAELSDPESQAAVLSRALDVFFFGSKTGSAAEAVRRVEQVLSDARGWPSDREPLVNAARAGVQLLAGTVRDSRNTADRVLVNAAAPQVAQLRALLVAAPSAAMAGRTNEALVHVERGLEIVRGGTAGTSTATDELVDVDAQALLTSTISFAKHLAGQLHEAASIARDGYRDAVQAHSHAAKGIWAFACGQVLYSEGRVRTATRMLREAATLLRNPPSILFTWCLGSLAQSASLSGDVKIAREALAEANGLLSQSFRVFDCELARGDAWCTAQSGDRIAGSEIARRAAEIAEERGQAAFAALAAHDAARLGATRPAARQLARLASECDGDFIPLLALHATAAADGAASLLESSSKDFEALGAQLLAAEAAADAARAYDAQGRPERARATANRARALASECEHARTPALASLPDGFNLSSREEQVARLAADGLSNRDIAARLHVSVRTVDNHLHRTYIKLGVDGRDQLRDLLRPDA